jgi:hypothetical protein
MMTSAFASCLLFFGFSSTRLILEGTAAHAHRRGLVKVVRQEYPRVFSQGSVYCGMAMRMQWRWR